MALETGVTYIDDLVATNPVGATDNIDEGDDHIRNIKTAVQGSFPNLGAAAVTRTAAQLNSADVITILDAPEQLISSTTGTGAWTQYDMSAGGTEAAAAFAAGAKKAILRCFVFHTSSTSIGAGNIFVEKNGLGSTVGNETRAVYSRAPSGESGVDTNDVIVNLDGNSDFEYYTLASNASAERYEMYFIGYYS